MNLLARLLSRNDPSEEPMPRCVHVYFDAERMLIASTNCVLARRTVAPGLPCYSLERDSAAIEIGNRVAECLAKSNINAPQDVFERELSAFFKLARVSGWQALGSSWWQLGVVQISKDEVEVTEYQKCRGGGYASDRAPTRVTIEAEVLGQQILQSIEAIDQSYYDEGGPSHT